MEGKRNKNEEKNEIKKLSENVNNILIILKGTNGFPGIVESFKQQGEKINEIDEAIREIKLKVECVEKIPEIEKDLNHLEMEVLGINKDGKGGMKNKMTILEEKPKKRFGLLKTVIGLIAVLITTTGGIFGIIAFFK
ncbi:MAG: hypothetical protein ACFFC1_03670 [Promethearchaeota archaeon]